MHHAQGTEEEGNNAYHPGNLATQPVIKIEMNSTLCKDEQKGRGAARSHAGVRVPFCGWDLWLAEGALHAQGTHHACEGAAAPLPWPGPPSVRHASSLSSCAISTSFAATAACFSASSASRSSATFSSDASNFLQSTIKAMEIQAVAELGHHIVLCRARLMISSCAPA